MTQVLSVVERKLAYMENSRKNRKICKDEQTLNTNKTELIFFSRKNSDFRSAFFYKNEVLTTKLSWYSNRQEPLFRWVAEKTLKNMAHALRSIYLIRHRIPLNARILLLKPLVLSHLSFSAIFLQNLSAKNQKRLYRQINCCIKVCFLRRKYDKARDVQIRTNILPAELIAKMSLIKFHYDITRPANSENFHGYLSLHQNTLTIQFKLRQNVKTNFGINSIVRQCVQKWNKFPQWLRLAKNENVFMKTLNEFLHSHYEKNSF